MKTRVRKRAPRAEARKDEAVAVADRPAAKGLLPYVLSWTAVAKGEMPESGSGLPPSLEADVPPGYRYWLADDPEVAKAARDALVEAQLFTPGSVKKLDGVPRRVLCEPRYFVLDEYEGEPVELEKARAPLDVAFDLLETQADVTVLTPDVLALASPERLAGFVEKSGAWLAQITDDVADVLKARARRVFRIKTRPDLSFASSEEVLPSDLVDIVPPEPPADVAKALESVRFAKADDEQRFVLGIVLEPDVVDSQKDTYSADEVRKTAHKFMAEFQTVGLQHAKNITGKAVVVESWIAPVDFDLGGSEGKVKKGTWLMGLHIPDDQIWKAVKDGKLTGLSIGGDAVRTPETGAA